MLEPIEAFMDKNRNINHAALMRITEHMPCKKIIINDELYLERYFVRVDENGVQTWLHRFLRPDAERHLHSHPWTATSTILVGCYIEEFFEAGRFPSYDTMKYEEGMVNFITPQKLHRISSVIPNTWTEMIVQPERADNWEFIDENGNHEKINSSPPDWWKVCKTRDGKDPKFN